ncbi:MAG: hypothetical protein ABI134_05420 [Byssovorax sp.]
MHARSRKIALAEASSRDEIADAFPSDDAVVIEVASFAEETRANERICLGCGGDGSRHEGCSHAEVARLHEPSRAAGEMVARLRRAAAEHRAASRALRALVTSELGRGRAELETTTISAEIETEAEATPTATGAPAPAPEATAMVPCPRCAERESEGEGVGAGVVVSPARAARKRGRAVLEELEVEGVVVSPPRAARKRGRAAIDQQSFPFLKEPLAAGEGEKVDAGEPRSD